MLVLLISFAICLTQAKTGIKMAIKTEYCHWCSVKKLININNCQHKMHNK